MERYIGCPNCKSEVTASFPTTHIAIGSKIACKNDMCNWIDCQGPSSADVPQPPTHQGGALIVRNVDFKAKVLFVLAFLTSGDGGVEVGRACDMLGLPNSTTIAARSFNILEEPIGPVLRQHAEGIVKANLVKEVKQCCGSQKDDSGALLFDL